MQIESLEDRILLSATWADADTGAAQTGATNDADLFQGGAAGDVAAGGNGADILHGNGGNDVLSGGNHADQLFGGEGNDILNGDHHDDVLNGGAGDDQLFGGHHNDTLISGGGNDHMDGGKHDDTFRFDGAQDGDVITVVGGEGNDTIDLSSYASNQVSHSGSQITVALQDGGSFQINHSGIENIATGAAQPPPDTAPIVDAGADATVDEADIVQLSGSASDAEGQNLSYEWVQTAGPTVTLSDAHAANPTFEAPEGVSNTDLSFELHVSDGTHTSVDTVTIHVNADNDAPSADAGLDQTVSENAPVQLTGAGSDIEGQNLSYEWVQTAGPAVTLDDAHAANPTFTAPEGVSNTDLTFELHVSDGTSTSIDTVAIHVNADNDAPSADAGLDQTVSENAPVQLTGAGSDIEGQNLSYEWVQTGGPAVTLDDAHAANPTFTAPNVSGDTPLTFELRVSDGDNVSIDTVTIHVDGANDAPVADAGADQYVHEGSNVALSAAGSHDADADATLTYQWRQTGGPAVTLTNASGASPTFVAPGTTGITTLQFEVTVSDGHGGTSVETVDVKVGDPVIEARVHSLNYTQFRELNADSADYLTPAQIASIPSNDWFNTIPASARASLDHDQVQAIDTSRVSIAGLTADQRTWLSEDQIEDLSYTQFRYLNGSQVDHLTSAQIATIPSTDWFNTMSAEARGSLDHDQVQAIDTSRVSIAGLNADQRTWLSEDQIEDLSYSQFRYLNGSQVDHLTPAQIATIPSTDWFNTMSAEARGSLDHDQVQAIDTSRVSIAGLTADQRIWLSEDQIEDLSYSQFRYLNGSQVDHLTPAQIATIPSTDWFNTMSAEARGSLDHDQVQAIDTSRVSIAGLTADQRTWLSEDQIEDLSYSQFRYLNGSQVDHLTPAQIATIPSTDWFNTMSAEARGSLDHDQVQAIDTSRVSIAGLTADQRTWLSEDQIEDLSYSQFRYLNGAQVDHLTPAQIATIPSTDWFNTMSAEARGSLDHDQVQAIDTSRVSIAGLTADQREWLSTDQIQDLSYSQFRYVPADRMGDLTTSQIASIPSTDWFNTLSAEQKDALSYDQIRAIRPDLAGISITGGAGDETLTGNSNVNHMRGLDGADELRGGAGRDVLDGGAGNDVLRGGAGSDLLAGGAGFDTADYSDATGSVTVDLTLVGAQNTGMGADTLESIEAVRGGAHDDTFAFSVPVPGATYQVDGGAGTNTIDLSQFDYADATFDSEQGVLTVALGDGESFQVNFQNIQSVQFGDQAVDPMNLPVADAPVDPTPEPPVDNGHPVLNPPTEQPIDDAEASAPPTTPPAEPPTPVPSDNDQPVLNPPSQEPVDEVEAAAPPAPAPIDSQPGSDGGSQPAEPALSPPVSGELESEPVAAVTTPPAEPLVEGESQSPAPISGNPTPGPSEPIAQPDDSAPAPGSTSGSTGGAASNPDPVSELPDADGSIPIGATPEQNAPTSNADPLTTNSGVTDPVSQQTSAGPTAEASAAWSGDEDLQVLDPVAETTGDVETVTHGEGQSSLVDLAVPGELEQGKWLYVVDQEIEMPRGLDALFNPQEAFAGIPREASFDDMFEEVGVGARSQSGAFALSGAPSVRGADSAGASFDAAIARAHDRDADEAVARTDADEPGARASRRLGVPNQALLSEVSLADDDSPEDSRAHQAAMAGSAAAGGFLAQFWGLVRGAFGTQRDADNDDSRRQRSNRR